jgi:ABC-type glycerol-3-phosphate transport system permease component
MRNYGRNIDDSLIEAASIDGAGRFRAFWHVFLPLSRRAVADLIVLCMIWSLQDFLRPSMLFTNPDLATAAQAVASFSNVLGRSPEDFGRYNASLVLLAIPAALFVLFVLFVLFGLRFIVYGLTSGSTKN